MLESFEGSSAVPGSCTYTPSNVLKSLEFFADTMRSNGQILFSDARGGYIFLAQESTELPSASSLLDIQALVVAGKLVKVHSRFDCPKEVMC